MNAKRIPGGLLLAIASVTLWWQWPVSGQAPPTPPLATVRPVGDGKTDDTAALQAAINAGTGRLELPRGTFRLTRSLEVHLAKTGPFAISGGGSARLVMAGPGPAIRIIGNHGGTAAPTRRGVRRSAGNRAAAPGAARGARRAAAA